MFFLIDKPIGMTSFDVIRKLRKILNIRKIGHTGTLDPLASGCLLIATEKSTKLIRELEKTDKEYIFTVKLDGTSLSLDAGTPITPTNLDTYIPRTSHEVQGFLESQESQIPPKYSALHVDGKRAYDLARKGIDFSLQERKITIKNVSILTFLPPKEIRISLTISSGGYIRSLAPMIGSFFGIQGGYVSELRRTSILLEGAILHVESGSSLENISPVPYSSLFPNIGNIILSQEGYNDIQLGRYFFPEYPEEYKIGKKYFLSYRDTFCSLCHFDGEKFVIERNDV